MTSTSGVNFADITILVEPEQPAYETFSIKHRFQQSIFRTPLQGNLRTRLQYQVYTLDNFFAFSVQHFLKIVLNSFLPEFFAVLPKFSPRFARIYAHARHYIETVRDRTKYRSFNN